MSDPLSDREVARIAALARLELSADERRQMAEQLGRILAFAGEVSSVDTSRVPDGQDWLPREPLERPDEARPSMDAAHALANAPETAAHLFLTPRVLPRD